MAKYSYEFKIQVVQEYLAGEGGYQYMANKHNISHHAIVAKWVSAFKANGNEGLLRSRQNKECSFEYSRSIIYFISTKSGNSLCLISFITVYMVIRHASFLKKYNSINLNDKNEIIAYYTLKANGIQMQNSEGTVDSVSSIELARFAVDHKFQSKGYGRLIFTYMIMPKIIEVSEIVGVNTVIVFVDEYNKHGIRFYHRLGFGLANDRIKNYIEEEFSKKCNIMYVSMEACLVYYNNAIKCFDIN